MGMRLVWTAFGAAVFYLIAAVGVPIIVVALRHRGIDLDDEAAKNVTRLALLIATPLGGALGMRHAARIQAERVD